jgi:hypothetical protein
MPTVSSEAGSAPAPQALLTRVIGVITSPGETFRSIAAHPKWLGVLVLVTVLGAIFAALPMTTEGGQQAALDQQVKAMEGFGMQVSDQMYEQMQQGTARMPYTTGLTVLIAAPLMSLILSAILFGIFAIMGGGASFKQVFAVYCHAAVISTVGGIFGGTINYFRGGVSSTTNLNALLPMLEEGTFASRIGGFVDLFIIWWLIVLAIGLGVVYRKRTQSVAIILFSIYAVIALGVAGVMSMFGGS